MRARVAAAALLLLLPAAAVGQRSEKAAPGANAGAVQALDAVAAAEADVLASHERLMQGNAQLAKLFEALSARVRELSKVSTDKGQASGDMMARMQQLQEMNQSFNLQYLALQENMQNESRRFSLLSNIMKTKHDTAKNSIGNLR